MSGTSSSLIERLVDAIKGYFSITGLMLVGIYLVKNPDDTPHISRYINYFGGFCAIASGAIISVWYSIHLFKNVFLQTERVAYKGLELILYGGLIIMAVALVLIITAGAISMSCSAAVG